MAKPPSIPRHQPYPKALEKYTSQVGRVVWASNGLHAVFLNIFIWLNRAETNSIAIESKVYTALWHSMRGDDLQRGALLAVAREAMEPGHPLAKALIWSLNSAGKLSEYRNDAVHTPFVFNRQTRSWKLAPNKFAGAPNRVAKLMRVGHEKLFKFLAADLEQLTAYADAIFDRVLGDSGRPLPRRPRLQSVLLVRRNPPPSNTRLRRPKGPRRPQ
jgi:hypothetical protein